MEPTSAPTATAGRGLEIGLSVGGAGIGIVVIVVAVFFGCKYRERKAAGGRSMSEGKEQLMAGGGQATDTTSEIIMA